IDPKSKSRPDAVGFPAGHALRRDVPTLVACERCAETDWDVSTAPPRFGAVCSVEYLNPMAEKKEQEQQANEELRPELPPGVKLLRTLEGHQGAVQSVAFDPQGETLASGSSDRTVKLWEVRSGKLLRTLKGQMSRGVWSIAFGSEGRTLASASSQPEVSLW